MLADANPTNTGVGGLMRPVNARRENLNVTLDKLGDALRAVCTSSGWAFSISAHLFRAYRWH